MIMRGDNNSSIYNRIAKIVLWVCLLYFMVENHRSLVRNREILLINRQAIEHNTNVIHQILQNTNDNEDTKTSRP